MIFLNCNIFQHFVQDVNWSKLPSRGQTQAFLEEEKYSDQNFSEVESAMRVQCTVSTLYSCAVLHSHIKGIVQCTVVHMCTTLCRAWLKVSLSQNPLHLSQPLQCLGIMNIIHLCSILSSSTILTPFLFRDFNLEHGERQISLKSLLYRKTMSDPCWDILSNLLKRPK